METVRQGLAGGKYVHMFSEWNTPTVVVYKPSATQLERSELEKLIADDPSKVFRLTHNYRFLNKQVSHPEVRLELQSRVVDTLSNPENETFMSMDFRNAFWTFPINPPHRHFFAFTAPDGQQYAPTVMPQGYSPAPFVCAAGVSLAFGPIPEPDPEPSLIGDNFRMFQDDGAGGFRTKEDLYVFLRDHFFPRVKWSRLTLHWGKTSLFVSSMKHLGLIFASRGRIFDPSRTAKILAFPIPTNASTVRSFVQTCQITRPHIKNFSEMARPLTRLTGSKVAFQWRDEIEGESFRLIKHAVSSAVERYGYDSTVPSILESDASDYGGGCVIKQVGSDGKERAILYDSFVLSQAEKKYVTFKKELCAIMHALKRWQCYLGGMKETIIRTDHRPLLGFQESAGKGKVEGIYARWAELLEMSNVRWEFLEGRRNCQELGVKTQRHRGENRNVW
jgi:hypothetical protein